MGGFRAGADVPAQFVAKVSSGGEQAATDDIALDLGEPQFRMLEHGVNLNAAPSGAILGALSAALARKNWLAAPCPSRRR